MIQNYISGSLRRKTFQAFFLRRRENMQVAIDGPASSGKSTISKFIAKETGFLYLDTGAMYRATTLAFLRNNISVDDASAIDELL